MHTSGSDRTEQRVAPVGAGRRSAGGPGRPRSGAVLASLAAPLWALQALIWLGAPKVQEPAPPHRITDVLLFELFWLSVAGAVAFSAAAALELARTPAADTQSPRWARALAGIALALATGATVSTAAAPIPVVQQAALLLLTTLGNAAMVFLVASLALTAVLGWRGSQDPAARAVSTVVAVTTAGLLGAILASGSSSAAGLHLGVVAAVLTGASWLLAGRHLQRRRGALPHRGPGEPVPDRTAG